MTRRSDRVRRGLLTFAVLAGCMGCTVKEDRMECPAYVTVLTDRFAQRGLQDGTVSFSADRLLIRDEINFLSYLRDGYEQACPRDYACAAVLSGVENSRLSEDRLFVPPGRQADLIWAFGTAFSAETDSYVLDAVPHKQYCLVKFLFDDAPTAPGDYPWRFRLLADCSGMNIYTLEPVEGTYRSVVGPNAVGEWYGVLPRQKTNNMRLEVFLPDEEDPDEGRTDYVLDLGKAFEKQGYDWGQEDLKDIAVKVGFSEAGICLTVQEWEGDDQYHEIEI